MKRIFTVHRGGLDREASVTEHKTVRTRAADHRRFNQAMKDTLREVFPDESQDNNLIHLMTPARSWGEEVREGLRQKASQEAQEASGQAFDSPVASLSPEIRNRLARA